MGIKIDKRIASLIVLLMVLVVGFYFFGCSSSTTIPTTTTFTSSTTTSTGGSVTTTSTATTSTNNSTTTSNTTSTTGESTTTTTTSTTTTTVDWARYYPTTEGLIRVYDETTWGDVMRLSAPVRTEEVGATNNIAALGTTATSCEITAGITTETDAFIVSANGVLYSTWTTESYGIPYTRYHFPLEVGTSWTTVEGERNLATIEVVAIEEVVVPAGTFTSYHITNTYYDAGFGDWYIINEWLVLDKGCVKYEEVAWLTSILWYAITREAVIITGDS